MKYLVGVVILCGVFLPELKAQDPTQKWAVRFEVPQEKDGDPVTHISILIKAPTEGQATILAFQHLQALTVMDVWKRVKFYDACKSKE